MLKVISLFSGSGGLDLGFIQTNAFDIILANDFNEAACLTYKSNIGHHIIHAGIKDIKAPPPADIIIGGPPCQGFSTANPKRSFEDPRNWLFKEYGRVLESSNPKVFLMENVSGMKTLGKGKVLDIIKNEFTGLGYKIYVKVLNAKYYECPQSRNRMFMVGVSNSIDKQYHFPTAPLNPPLWGRFLTTADAFSKEINKGDSNHQIGQLSNLNLERIKHIPQGGSMKDCPEFLRNNSDIKRAMRRLDLNEPSYTIVHNNCDHYYHPTEDRRITIREMARLQTYPDDFTFYGSKSDQSRQVANSVPVKLAYHIALSIKEFLND